MDWELRCFKRRDEITLISRSRTFVELVSGSSFETIYQPASANLLACSDRRVALPKAQKDQNNKRLLDMASTVYARSRGAVCPIPL